MFGLIMICSAPPFIIEKIKKPSWKIAHPDTVLLDLDDGKTRSRSQPPRPLGAGPASPSRCRLGRRVQPLRTAREPR